MMDISVNIPDWLKIPLRILLPAGWLFSGTMILLPDAWLRKLYMLDWAHENGFVFGLVFLITSCLLLVYVLSSVIKKAKSLYGKLTLKRATFKAITAMNDVQQTIIFKLYNAQGYTAQLDYNQPVVQALLAAKFIYMGGQQQVSLDVFTNSIPAYFTLQPFVFRTLDHYRPKLAKRIEKMERKLSNTRDPVKQKSLREDVRNAKEYFQYIYKGGLD